MQCQKCSRLMPDENNYCGNCGTPLQGSRILFKDCVDGGLIKAGDKIKCTHKSEEVLATVRSDGKLEIGGKVFNDPPEAMEAARGVACDSWHCWKFHVASENRDRPIMNLKAQLKAKRAAKK